MAEFSLSLTNGRGTTVLTQYNALKNETAGLTFDENLQLSVDGSTLSFSMLKYLYEGSQKVVNTAALSIIYGSVIQCIHNSKRHDFAVTNIDYGFMSENLRLDFKALDYFQFENSQIGIGYTITTDTTDPEYLGAQPIDEWAYKIIRDNNIRWTYTPINAANPEIIQLLNSTTDRQMLFTLNDNSSTETAYWDAVAEDKTLNTWVSFECSNSNAFAALKQLATDNELIIEVNYSNHSFCFKPQKSLIFNGYYFNPANNLQAFSVSGSADNLVTILNVTGGKDLNNQEITLVPSVPAAIGNWINSGSSYTKTTYDWLFTDWYAIRDGENTTVTGSIVNNTDNNLTFTLNFTWDGGISYPFSVIVSAHSTYNYNDTQSVSTTLQNLTLSVTITGEPAQVLLEYPGTYPASIHSQYSVTDAFAGWDDSIYYPSLYDKYAANYPQFVREIAYTPWFENKLIDISYFSNNHLLLPNEIFDIQDRLYNKLRIINAKMIVAQSTYLQKYEKDYMDNNQRQIDAETLNAGLIADVEGMCNGDLTKPPIFITKAANNNTDSLDDPKYWVYIAPGTNLWVQTDAMTYPIQVTYEDIAHVSSSYFSNGLLENYLGPNPSANINEYNFYPSTDIQVRCKDANNTNYLDWSLFIDFSASISTIGAYEKYQTPTWQNTHFQDNTWYIYHEGILSTNQLKFEFSYLNNIKYHIDIIRSNSAITLDINNGAVENVVGINAGNVAIDTNARTVTISNLSTAINIQSVTITFVQCNLSLSYTLDSVSYTNVQLQYTNGQWTLIRTQTPAANTYLIGTEVQKLRTDVTSQNFIFTTPFQFNFCILTVPNADSLPNYIYVKDDLPSQLQLYTRDSNANRSKTLTITKNNLANIATDNLYNAQVFYDTSPTTTIAGLADQLNTICSTREAMLQHLADNWGALIKEWYREIDVNGTTHYVCDLYSTYRKIGILDNNNDNIAVGQNWSTTIADAITETDFACITALCQTANPTRAQVITTTQTIHTKITEYWTQCYNAAMSLGIYWPQDWDCIDILERRDIDIFAFNSRLLGLHKGLGLSSNSLRWKIKYPSLNLYYAPVSNYDYQNWSTTIPISHTYDWTCILYTGISSNHALHNIDIQLSFAYIKDTELKEQNYIANLAFNDRPSGTLWSRNIQLPGYNDTSILKIEVDSVNRLLLTVVGGYTPTNALTNVRIKIVKHTLKLNNVHASSSYAHSFKFMDDNNTYRATPLQSDNTQFVYKKQDSTNVQPYDEVLETHTAQDNLNLYRADLRYKGEHYTNFNFEACKLPAQWLAEAVDFEDNSSNIKPTGESSDVANPNLRLITYLASAQQYNNSEYYKNLYLHNKQWQELYQLYPGVFRESTYANTNAINSQELYEAAKRELTKLSQPAYSYNLTGMDIYMYDSDYLPTRIKLGDQIRIDYQEMNELNDSLNAALREPLYVTGINHVLRDDGNYEFTVTTRSATDTMMQRFAQLLTFNR